MFSKEEENLFSQQNSNDDKYEVSKFCHNREEKLIHEKFSLISKKVFELEPNKFLKYKNTLPLARIKRIMKIDKDVRMVSAETSVILAKACELFIIELACKSYVNSILFKRKTLQKCDLQKSIMTTENYDFLVDVVDEKSKMAIEKFSENFYQSQLTEKELFKKFKFPTITDFSDKNKKSIVDSNPFSATFNKEIELESQIIQNFINHYTKFNCGLFEGN